MTNKLNLTGYAITGAVVLLVGLAGDVQAVPISIIKNPGLLVKSTKPATTPGAVLGGPINATTLLLTGSAAPGHAGSFDFSSTRLPKYKVFVFKPPVIAFIPPTHNPAAVNSVPDGGITVAMLGGVFSAMVFLKRKQEAKSSR